MAEQRKENQVPKDLHARFRSRLHGYCYALRKVEADLRKGKSIPDPPEWMEAGEMNAPLLNWANMNETKKFKAECEFRLKKLGELRVELENILREGDRIRGGGTREFLATAPQPKRKTLLPLKNSGQKI